jgi:hypothetical protein
MTVPVPTLPREDIEAIAEARQLLEEVGPRIERVLEAAMPALLGFYARVTAIHGGTFAEREDAEARFRRATGLEGLSDLCGQLSIALEHIDEVYQLVVVPDPAS